MSKRVLLLVGGGGAEHEISKVSAKYIKEQLTDFPLTEVEISQDNWWDQIGEHLKNTDYVIPCLHGTPGETGEIQPLLESFKLPYFGCDAWTSSTLFNKVTTKLWCDAVGIPNTPYLFLTDKKNSLAKVEDFFDKEGSLFIKAASQGSSVGCYLVSNKTELKKTVQEAFKFSNQVLVEKSLKTRELEVAAYQIGEKWHITAPGEILTQGFYDYEEKYSSNSQTQTKVVAEGISSPINEQIQQICLLAIKTFGLRHLSRIDFFLTEQNELFLNEINTFPGMTPISMFPKMLENNGHSFKEFLVSHIG